ncbi:MAG: ABC-type transport system permease involved in multi-copper enzyme maturation [Candidatus Methanohalarchaeum thermophilum]|uniref:ABC-type transport system permease involved in multi-copper enzyme maturation n=1 Tax=Methanohalarchaeum thermophilum TaxID=1903181 RepID=A0A1Q6DSB2_METT1|nr:MAG: ABC-type transport system permease involved in multi-copper enzyme maturation [Candidatus Methanohalarchaeum thermophilum]
MLPITSFDFKRKIKSKIGVSIALTALALLIIGVFPSIQESGVDFGQYIENLPPAFAKAFGASIANYNTIEGFLSIEFYSFFWLAVLGAYFAYKGGSLISGEIENQRIDLILSNPVSRTRIAIEKFLSLLPDILIINIIVASSIYLGTIAINEKIALNAILKVHAASIPFWLACGALGLLISTIINQEKRSQLYAAGIIFAMYLIETITIETKYEILSKLSFTHYYKPVNLLSLGEIEPNNVIILTTLTLILVALSTIIFEKKDIKT